MAAPPPARNMLVVTSPSSSFDPTVRGRVVVVGLKLPTKTIGSENYLRALRNNRTKENHEKQLSNIEQI